MNYSLGAIYLLSLGIMVRTRSFLVFWVFIEITTVLFCVIVLKRSSFTQGIQESKNQIFYYFIMQSVVSLIILIGILIDKWLPLVNERILISFCLVFKLGMFPFYLWVLKISKFLRGFGIFLLLIPQKVYLIYLCFNLIDTLIFSSLWISIYLGSLLMFKFWGLKEFLVASSISSGILGYCLFAIYPSLFFLFFFYYAFLIGIIFFYYSFNDYIRRIILLYSSLIFISSPFSFFFLFKFQAIKYLFLFGRNVESLIFWLGLFLIFLGYYLYFHRSFILGYSFYKNLPIERNILFVYTFIIFTFCAF